MAQLASIHEIWNEQLKRRAVAAVRPQVAATAERQWQVSKTAARGKVVSSVVVLDDQGRIEEIARMLGGVKITATTRQHAAEMLGKKIK